MLRPRRSATGRFLPGAPLVGREREAARLSEALAQARAGTGTVVLVAGEAGVGKSRLLEEAALREGGVVCAGQAFARHCPPWGPLAAALRVAVEAAGGPGALAPDEAAGLAPLLPDLAPQGGEASAAAAPGAAGATGALVEAIAAVLGRAGAGGRASGGGGPVVLLLDDLHWADAATLDLLAPLAARLRAAPVALLGAFRPDEVPADHALRRLRIDLRRARRLDELELGPLGAGDSARLVEGVVGAAPAPALARALHARTGGIPLFVEELARALAAEGALEPGPDGLALRAGRSVPLPATARDAVLVRLDGLSARARALLELVAVAGAELELALAAEDEDDERALDELLAAQLLFEAPGARAAFRNELAREAVLGEVPWSRRRALQRKLAQRLEVATDRHGEVAALWAALGERTLARRAWLRAAQEADARGARRDAAAALERALEGWAPGEDDAARAAALERLAAHGQAVGDLALAARAWRERADHAGREEDAAGRGAALAGLAAVLDQRGGPGPGASARAAAVAAFEQAGRPAEAAAVALAEAERHLLAVRLEAAAGAAEGALALAERSGDSGLRARALGLAGLLAAQRGRPEAGRALLEQGLALALERDVPEAAAEVYRRAAAAAEHGAELTRARGAFEAALAFCEGRGAATQALACRGCFGYVLFRLGDWRRALEVCRPVLDDPATPLAARAGADVVLGMVHAHKGERRPARRHLAAAHEASLEARLVILQVLLPWGFARAAALDGDEAGAREHLRTFLRGWSATEDRHEALPALVWAVTAFARGAAEVPAGDAGGAPRRPRHGPAGADEARRDVDRCIDALTRLAALPGAAAAAREVQAVLAHARAERARLGDGPPEAGPPGAVPGAAAVAAARDAAALGAGLEAPHERAVVLWRAGEVLAAAGDRAAGGALLEQAEALARRLGARPLAALVVAARAALAPQGRARRKGGHGELGHAAAGLTERQLDVARHVARGLTNKEIALRLHLSPRTVDMHVSHILGRLDASTRTEAARRLLELGVE